MMKPSKPIRITFFYLLLLLLCVTSLIPIVVLILQALDKLDQVRNLSNETSELIVRDQTAQISIAEAQHIAQSVAELFRSCEADLQDLSLLPIDPHTFQNFAKAHQRWVTGANSLLPIYKEIAYIDRSGYEQVKICDGEIIPKDRLVNVALPQNTTFKSETYFTDTINSGDDLHVTHLTGWYVSQPEQVYQGKTYIGVIRFCKKITDKRGIVQGIYMLGLDHRHLMQFIEKDPKVPPLELYKTGNYSYLIDDEGWIIAHPKLWDIRGLDKDGRQVEPFTEHTPGWKIDAGIIPQNLTLMDWRLRDIYSDEPMSSIINRVQRGETAVYTMKSTGIHNVSEGIIRTRACAPIFYDKGVYRKHGIAGAVVVGLPMENLVTKTKRFTSEIEIIGSGTKKYMISLALALAVLVLIVSFFFAKSISRAVIKLTEAISGLGRGDYHLPSIDSTIKELNELSAGVSRLSVQLKDKDEKIQRSISDLELANIKLAEAQKQLDSYWKREYEIETPQALEEKITLYEKEYPKLAEIRKKMNIGSSLQFLRVMRQIVPLSQMTIPVWIYGETGVGKTALARTMHALSPRHDGKIHFFEAIEFSAADPMIVMGKLFGFGSGHGLVGIDRNGQKGILEECDGGTLVVDDVDALPLDTQAQLLRVVDGHSFHPAAGKTRNITSDIRFIFVSNVNLELKVKEGSFRKDFFRRIGGNINKIVIPALRERRSDIPLLADYFIGEYNRRYKEKLTLSKEAVKVLCSHDYREGNIGELRMIIELACENTRIEGRSTIGKDDLPHQFLNHKTRTLAFPDIELSPIFSPQEKEKITVLRDNLFRMEIAEVLLGFKEGSHTLSHHLRGICFKSLAHSDWDVDAAVERITTLRNDKIFAAVKAKILGYIDNIKEKVETQQVKSLYKNLPKEYHAYLEKAIEHFAPLN